MSSSGAGATRGRGEVPAVYAILDTAVLTVEEIPIAAGEAASAGVRWIQVRAKGLPDGRLASLVESCGDRLEGAPVRLWVNDRPDVAAIFEVGGVHLGQDDLEPSAARGVVGSECWIGRSTHDEAQVAAASDDPAVDVIAVGPVFRTTGKERPDPVVGLDLLRRARRLSDKPIVAIGGIDESRLEAVLAAGADSAAMIGAVCRGRVGENCRRLVARAAAAGRPC